MKKALLAVLAALAASSAFATQPGNGSTFNVGGGFGSSVSISGGSQATADGNGNGYSSQAANSSSTAWSYGGTGMISGVGALPVGFGVVAGGAGFSGSIAGGWSGSNAIAGGYTTGDGHGTTKAGSGADYASYGYSGLNGSYSYSH